MKNRNILSLVIMALSLILLLLSWIDSYGIRRMAVDWGLLEEEGGERERVLVFLTDGTRL